eukprot:COSAG06_NODE_54_length_27948_cov_234.398671_14_plen_232_part_00
MTPRAPHALSSPAQLAGTPRSLIDHTPRASCLCPRRDVAVWYAAGWWRSAQRVEHHLARRHRQGHESRHPDLLRVVLRLDLEICDRDQSNQAAEIEGDGGAMPTAHVRRGYPSHELPWRPRAARRRPRLSSRSTSGRASSRASRFRRASWVRCHSPPAQALSSFCERRDLARVSPNPRRGTGFIIGKGGRNIDQIEKASGAKLSVSDRNGPESFGKEWVYVQVRAISLSLK